MTSTQMSESDKANAAALRKRKKNLPSPKPKKQPQSVTATPVDGVDEELEQINQSLTGRTTRIMRKAVDFAREHSDSAVGETMLDDTIYTMRMSGLSHKRIANELGATITENEVTRRLGVIYAKMEEMTSTEYRMLQVARLEAVINMCYSYAQDGSEGHIELLLKAIERLNKMFELESEKSKIEVEIVTDAQAVMLMHVISGVLQVLLGDPRVLKAIPAEEINEITANALDAAEQNIVDEQGNTVTVDLRKAR